MEEDDNQVEGSYSYTIQATAEGGAIASVEGQKTLALTCTATVVENFDKVLIFELPESGSKVEEFPSSSA
jgi:hypothetical protein